MSGSANSMALSNPMQHLRFSAKSLARNRRRTLIALATIIGGLVAQILASGFINWVLYAMREATILSQLGHVQITQPNYFKAGVANPYGHLLPQNSAGLDAAKRVDGVVTITPRLAFSGLASHDDKTVSFVGDGVAPETESLVSVYLNVATGSGLAPDDTNGAVLGKGLAEALGVGIGDAVVLLATTADGRTNAVEVEVRGTFTSVAKEYDDNAMRIPIKLARELVQVEGATTWVALFEDTARSEALMGELAGIFRPEGFELTHWRTLADYYVRTEALFKSQISVVKLMISVIIVLTISNTLFMTVLERTREIGLRMALGATATAAVAVLLRQTLLQLALGAVIGIGLVLGVGQWLSTILYGVEASDPISLIGAAALLVSVALLVAAWPAWRARGQDLTQVLRAD